MDFGWILNDGLDGVKQEGKGSFQEEETMSKAMGLLLDFLVAGI